MSASLAQKLPSPGPMAVAVTSGKGGVGKSQIVASLAVLLRQAGRRTLLVDADVGCGDLDVLLDVRSGDLRQALTGACPPEELICRSRMGDIVLDLLPAPSADRRGADLSEGEQLGVLSAVDRVGAAYELVLVDTGAGVTRNPMLFAAAADRVLVVTTPEPTAMQDAYAAMKVLHQAHRVDRFELVVNLAASEREGRRVYAKLASVVDRFLPVELGLAGVLPADERVGRAVRARQPVALAWPHSDFTRALKSLARRLADGPPARPGGQLRYFTRNASSLVPGDRR